MSSPQRLPIRTKLAYGVGAGAGAGAQAAVSIAFNVWNFLFYNHVLGLSGTLCGLAVALSLVLDAVADPVVGFMSDRWHSKLGRRHPFLYTAPLPLALSFYCIYVPPAGLTGVALFAWFTFFTILFRQFLTIYQVPHLALGAELSTDYRERSMTSGMGTILAGLAIDVIHFPQGAKPGEVGADVLFKLGLVDGPIAAVPALLAIYFYGRYAITEQSHAEMQRTLAARRKPPLAAAASDRAPAPAESVIESTAG